MSELNKRERRRRPTKLNVSIFRILILGWVLPLALLSATVFYSISEHLDRKTRESIQESADAAVDVCEIKLGTAIQASRNASYIPSIKESWQQYQEDGNEQRLYTGIYDFLSKMYKYDEKFRSTMVYFTEEGLDKFYYIYSGSVTGDYDSVRFFKNKGFEEVKKLADSIETQIGFVEVEDRLYLVRNIVGRDFKPFATIVMDLRQDIMFDSLDGVEWYKESYVYVDGECVYATGDGAEEMAHLGQGLGLKSSIYQERDGKAFVCREKNLEGCQIRYVVELDREGIHYERNTIKTLVIVMMLFTLPLICMICWFIYRNVTKPINRLVEFAYQIENGKFGYQITSTENSQEFTYLVGAFNSMSDKLKTQFEQIYLEELALRDADIKALQSQINPHFLNNTLEIINWEARMEGNDKVSSMIEALSTMLEATLNRKKQPMIPLSEELEYVDAYCHIIKQRFGERVQFDKQIDERLLKEKVPRLIIQPIIENAVEHGAQGGRGKILLRIYQEEDKLKIEVYNDGKLKDQDKERIDRLLSGKGDTERFVSLGISNVNKRLKIIYGPDCGLTIKSDKEERTVSTITVKLHKCLEQIETNFNK